MAAAIRRLLINVSDVGPHVAVDRLHGGCLDWPLSARGKVTMSAPVRVSAAFALLPLVGCVSPPERELATNGPPTFEEFKASLARDEVSGRYHIDGDLLISEVLLHDYYNAIFTGNALIVHGTLSPIIWNDAAKLQLTYCSGHSFSSARKQSVIDTLDVVAAEWESAAAVNFIHVSTEDGAGCTNSNDNVLFNVTYTPVIEFGGADFAGEAFVPGEARAYRVIFFS